MIEYTDEEYEKYLTDLDLTWTKEETDYLWDLCKQFDLRFIVIHDRYDDKYCRSIENLKNRYYTVSRKILEERKHFDHPIINSGYSYEQEMKRRACLERLINKSKDELEKEEETFKKAQEIEEKIEKIEKVENNLKALVSNNYNLQTFVYFLYKFRKNLLDLLIQLMNPLFMLEVKRLSFHCQFQIKFKRG
jgi:DNA methyltransferase 1-associated protein 1